MPGAPKTPGVPQLSPSSARGAAWPLPPSARRWGQTLKHPNYSRHAEEAWLQSARTLHAFLPGPGGQELLQAFPQSALEAVRCLPEKAARVPAVPAPAPDLRLGAGRAAAGGRCREAGGGRFLFTEKGRVAALGFAQRDAGGAEPCRAPAPHQRGPKWPPASPGLQSKGRRNRALCSPKPSGPTGKGPSPVPTTCGIGWGRGWGSAPGWLRGENGATPHGPAGDGPILPGAGSGFPSNAR